MRHGRTPTFQRNEGLEALLPEVQRLLSPAHERILAERVGEGGPLLFIVGAPRSGTTLLLQWLAASGAIAYPSNLLSRFYGTPTVGALVHLLACDHRFQHGDELKLAGKAIEFRSDLGKTRGAAAPNEFWYFWRRFLPTVDIEPLGERVSEADFEGLRAELLALSAVMGAPFACKGMMIQYDLEAFAKRVPEARFVFCTREVKANADSLLRARERFFGDTSRWYSARPEGYEALVGLSPERQVEEQVKRTVSAIRSGLTAIDPQRWIEVPLEAFLSDSSATWTGVRTLVGDMAELPAVHPAGGPFGEDPAGGDQAGGDQARAERDSK